MSAKSLSEKRNLPRDQILRTPQNDASLSV